MGDFDVFLSYHWRDHAAVEGLAQRLRGAGLHVFLDRWYLAPGTTWMRTLEDTLAGCRAVAICIGSEMGSWQQREADAALDRQVNDKRDGKVFPVIPVLLPGAEAPLGFLRQNTWVDLGERTDDPQRLAILAKAIRGEPPGPELQAAAAQSMALVCPYRGLNYFREEDAAFFFGREAATAQLVEAVGSHRLVAVVGASGSGKSSVVRAGLVPALRERREDAWEIVTLVPNDRPLYNLSAAMLPLLEPGMSEVDRLGETQKLADQFMAGRTRLRDVVRRVLELQPGTQRLLLVVDQWEELFTLTENADQRQCFIDNLLEATLASALNVVLTLRGDYFGRAVTSQRELSDRLQGAQVNLGPMTEEELRCAVVKPAKQVGLEFETNLVELILEHAVGEPGHLPLLEFVLRELWEKRQGGVMHRAAYDAMGQLEGAIAKRADALYEELTRSDPQAEQRIRSIVLRLVRPGEGELDTRRRVLLEDFDAPTTKLVEQLATARLLVSSADVGGQSRTVEVAHEALIARWKRLREWVDGDRQFLAWRQRLDDDVAEWQRQKRSSGLLLQGLRLAEARDWMKRRREDLSKRECAYIRASALRRKLVVSTLSTAAGIAAVAVLGFGFYANQERHRADEARNRAEGLVDYMVFDLRDILAPVGRLDLMTGINERVNAYYEQLGAAASLEVSHRRAAALDNQGDTLLALGQLDAARKAYEQALLIRERLTKADASDARWQRDLSVSYSKLGDVAAATGQLDAARKAYEQARGTAERLAKADPSNTEWQRVLSVSNSKLGDVAVATGQLDAARKAYEHVLATIERLAKADPSSTEWQRDLSVSYERLCDVEVASGRLDAARKACEQALAIAEQLAKADASNTQWQSDLSISYDKLGGVEVAAGRLDAARKVYEQALATRELLAKTDPSNTEWQRDLLISYNNLGDVAVATGQRRVARNAYEQALAIAERLATADASNTQWQRDLSVSYDKLGDVEMAARQLDAARKAYERALAIKELLATADSSNTRWQRDLSVSYENLGNVEVAAGHLDAALKAYERMLSIAERLAKADPSNTEWQRDLSVSYSRLGNLELAAGQLDAARGAYERMLLIAERLAKADPSNAEWQHDLCVSYSKLGAVSRRQGKTREAFDQFEQGRGIVEQLVMQDPTNATWRKDLDFLQARINELRGEVSGRR
ncbi:tetratricopeptide repeat protein [Variovorax sp. J22R115]|uniref:nSTAND1 domain-containing NTPase n=1 Tax=Variovorax sp. J22R115 TaxID=3053509 RepID=UPI002575C9C6|nr:tetratricopeptide repeat protein [Variovorax sp. J22R115]MDM0053751.1 tetratricopeptide repeat protein [Variovorax sp. J22R115]